ncbi:MAG TPA: hypothetical protein VH143_04145 [Kofleriaceae bacterium]|jgi:hypothetical protein|nr:hypothetical protein [Kofleriaceae bacterium]
MQTITKTSLESVTGGTGSTIAGGSATAGATTGSTTGGTLGTGLGTGSCGGLGGAFSSLNNELAQLKNNNNGGFNSTDMLMFGMAMMMSRPAEPVLVYGGGGGGYGGYGGYGGGCHHGW